MYVFKGEKNSVSTKKILHLHILNKNSAYGRLTANLFQGSSLLSEESFYLLKD